MNVADLNRSQIGSYTPCSLQLSPTPNNSLLINLKTLTQVLLLVYMDLLQLESDVKYVSIEEIPVSKRTRTDAVCCLYLLAYILILSVALFALRNQTNLNKITYPTDNQGRLCGYDLKGFPYVYYTSLTDPTKRLCVSQCPKTGQTVLQCMPTNSLGCAANNNTQYQVVIYNTYLDQGRIGLFCLPTNPTLKTQILKISNTQRKYDLYSVMDTFFTCAWITALIGPLCFLFIQYQPYKVVPWTILIGGIICIFFGFYLLILPGYLVVKVILCILFEGMGIISLRSLILQKRRDSVVVCTRFVHASTLTHYSQQTLEKDHISCKSLLKLLKPLLFIIIFIGIYVLFFIVVVFEVLAAWSYGTLVFIPSQPFYRVEGTGSVIAMILILFQLLWVISFLRQSFNFIAGSHAIYWYFSKDGQASFSECFELLIKYHMGSVSGSAFLNGIFYFLDLFADFFIAQGETTDQAIQNVEGKLCKPYYKAIGYDRYLKNQSNCIKDLFNLIRGEAIYYVAMINLPYCNAARYCEFLRSNSSFYYYSQLTNRLFRINMHVVPIFFVLMIGIFIMGTATTAYAILIITVLVFFIITFFLSYHLSKADALLIATYTDEALNTGQLTKAPDIIALTYQEDMHYNYQDRALCHILCTEPLFNSSKAEL